MDAFFSAAIESNALAGAIMLSANKDHVLEQRVVGVNPSSNQPLSPDSILWLASCTKLVTAIAILQLFERQLITLDEDVTLLLSDLASLPILQGFADAGDPILKKRDTPITLKALLAHTAGFRFPFLDPNLQRYQTSAPSKSEKYVPLVFPTGQSWSYGTSLYWTGKLVEKLSGTTLEEYFQNNIFKPLSIPQCDIGFWPDEQPDWYTRFFGMSQRTEDGRWRYNAQPPELGYLRNSLRDREYLGGSGLFGTLPAYIRILQSLLPNSSLPALLRPETIDLLFKPQLPDAVREILQKQQALYSGWDKDVKVDWAFGGIVSQSESEKGRRTGTLSWGGLPNLYWFIDRTAGLCGIFGTQLLPFGDQKAREGMRVWEDNIYRTTVP